MWHGTGRSGRRASLVFGLVSTLVLACGGDSSTGPAIDEAFIGTWDATSFVVAGTELITPESSFFVSLGLYSDGSYELIVTGHQSGLFCEGPASCNIDGDYTFTGDALTFDPGTEDELNATYSVSGDLLTVSGTIDGIPFSATLERG